MLVVALAGGFSACCAVLRGLGLGPLRHLSREVTGHDRERTKRRLVRHRPSLVDSGLLVGRRTTRDRSCRTGEGQLGAGAIGRRPFADLAAGG